MSLVMTTKFLGSSNPSHNTGIILIIELGREGGNLAESSNFADQIQVEVKRSTRQKENSPYLYFL